MTEDSAPEDQSQDSAAAQIEYYGDLLTRLAQDTLARYAFHAYAYILSAPSTDITGDYFYWPYAEPMENVSLSSELTFVFKEAGSEIFEVAYESHVTQFAVRVAGMISDAEEDLLWDAILHKSKRSMTTTELQQGVMDTLVREIIRIAKDNDTEVIIAEMRCRRITFNPVGSTAR